MQTTRYAILAIVAGISLALAPTVMVAPSAFAVVDDDNGLANEENQGQCQKNFNDNACKSPGNKKKFTGPDRR